MVVELDIRSYLGWLLNGTNGVGAIVQFGITFIAIAMLALIGGFIVQLIRHGPMKAGDLIYRGFIAGVRDLTFISPRRVAALSYLAIKESLRRRAPVALGVFVLILVFAGWFLQTNYQEPAKLNLSFVLSATTYLVLILGLLLSAFSLPNDFKNRTIYTIVTKPVRPVDIILGRILGFGLMGSVMLVLMGIGGYVFVNRTLDHQHVVELETLENITAGRDEVIGKEGRTSVDNRGGFHRHQIQVDTTGAGIAESNYNHQHAVTENNQQELVTGSPLQVIKARVPKLGSLRFLGRNGQPVEKGVSVGSEWTYRSNIEGGTAAAAIWRFENITTADLRTDPDGDGTVLPIELVVRVFRTYKGDIETGIQGSIQLQNPETGLKSNERPFPAKDDQIDSLDFPMEQYDSDQNPIHLMDDLVSSDGTIDVVVRAIDRSQYFGFAQADCYIRRPDGSPAWNYIKSCLSIWAQMMVVITIGVTASTFLNGPIATLFTVAMILLGFSRDFFSGVARGTEWGGGPIESLVRMVTQMNVMSPFEESRSVSLMKGADSVLQVFMQGVALILPDFTSLSTSNYVANGFSIPGPLVGRSLTIALAYLVGFTIASYFMLRTREVAKD